jgi:DNA-directed RNA polymerase subunit RPC12/RpoP
MNWENYSCPQCDEEIDIENQVRCSNCKVLFNWDDEE